MQADIRELARARERISDLEYQVECLRRDLGQEQALETRGALQRGFAFSGKEAAIVAALNQRRGRPMTKSAIMNAVYGGPDEPQAKIIDVFICKIRHKMPQGSIATIWGAGHLLTEIGAAAIDAALQPLARAA